MSLKLGPRFSKFVSSPENLTILPPKNQENHISSKTLATEIYLWTLVEANTFLATREITLKLILLVKNIFEIQILLLIVLFASSFLTALHWICYLQEQHYLELLKTVGSTQNIVKQIIFRVWTAQNNSDQELHFHLYFYFCLTIELYIHSLQTHI